MKYNCVDLFAREVVACGRLPPLAARAGYHLYARSRSFPEMYLAEK
jgi:hypothetical protein